MKPVTIRFPLPMLKRYVEQAGASGLDLSTYLRAQLAAHIERPANLHAIRTAKD